MTTLDLGGFAARLGAGVSRPGTRPWVVRLQPGELPALESVCARHAIVIRDALERQLADLAAVRAPASSSAEQAGFVARALAERGAPEAAGAWVYLPWARTLSHLLEADDYFEVVTNRNQDKLTAAELSRLRGKRVGVMGLSVGGEAAVTVAQEHLCGHLVLADFDGLDLSNLNRLGAGFDELGENKAVIVARRIARIDPYLHVTVLEDGVTEENLDAFLEGLDLLIEECDSMPMKRAVRLRARARGLDVVYAGDERGFLSVEPYAGAPELRPFHGRCEAPQPSREAYPTPLAFFQALTEWLGGWDSVSARTRGSLPRVGETLCGYPQLAGEARLAAGQVAHAARRLLLGERLAPFLGHLDLEEWLRSAGPAAPGGG